jgi:hypothetical protein
MTLEDLVNKYNEKSKECFTNKQEHLNTKVRWFHLVLANKDLTKIKKNIAEYNVNLLTFDESLKEYLNPTGALNDLMMKSRKLEIVLHSRKIFVENLIALETKTENLENLISIKFSITLALFTFCVSTIIASVSIYLALTSTSGLL